MTPEVSKAIDDSMLDELREAFQMFDRDSNGTIDKEELMFCLNAMGHFPSSEEMNDLMARIDTDNSGAIDFDEFCAIMAGKMNDEETAKEIEELRNTFQLLDKDGSGQLDADELQRALKILGVSLTEEEAQYLLTEIDTDGNGDISFDEFMTYVMNFKGERRAHDGH